MNSNDFSIKIEETVIADNISYFDAIVEYCGRYDMELETAAKLINQKIKTSIESEVSDLNLLKTKIKRLPI